MDPQDRKLAAILSADVAGYSRLMADDEVATMRTLAAYRDEIALLVRQHRGRVVDAPGDNVLAEFPSALDAARCAVDIQRVVRARNADLPPHRKMEFRIGLHLGDVLVDGERIAGDGVNIAARLERLAEPGEVCVSGAVYEQVRGKLALPCEDLGERTVKHIPHPVRCYRLRLRADDGAGDRAMPAAAELGALAGRPDVAIFVVPTAWVVYVAIVFEIIFMASPFGLYFYSVYGPPLNVLHRSAWTAWLTGFFLPHFSQTSSPALNALRPLGVGLVLAGAAVFAAGFVQIYVAKLRRRHAVTGGLYRLARHPQYLGLAVVGLGALLIWPRFLVLIAYITMLFFYALLAGWEEERCLRQFGEPYDAYWRRTGMFWPRPIARNLRRLLPAGPAERLAVVAALYAMTVIAGVYAAGRLLDYSLAHVSTLYAGNLAVLSPARLTEQELDAAVRVATGEAAVGERLAAAGPAASLLVYVVPMEWELADLPIELPEARHGGHYTPSDFDRRRYRVLFTRARTYAPGRTGEAIVKAAYGRDPVVLVTVDIEAGRITGIEKPPPHVIWGDIPTPLF